MDRAVALSGLGPPRNRDVWDNSNNMPLFEEGRVGSLGKGTT